MLKQFKMNSIIFDDQITLLKPLGYNLVSFYHKNLKTLVIFHPALRTIVKSYKVQDISDYAFRDDRKYFYTSDDQYFWIYQTSDDGYYLLSEHMANPIGFQQNYILCMKDNWADSSSEDDFGISSGNSQEGSDYKGIVALKNLANTSFMNCTNQCLSNVETLKDYFLGLKYLEEINENNPL